MEIMKTPAEIIQTALNDGRKALFEHEAKELLRAAGIIVPKGEIVDPRSEKELLAVGEKLGFPLALKAESAEVLHKTEASVVVLDIKNDKELSLAAKHIGIMMSQRAPNAVVRHFLVERMMPAGLELLIGGLRDEQFGPAVAFGLGGVFTELLHDVTHRFAPFDAEAAREMINEVKGAALLTGYRGRPALDVAALADALARVSLLIADHADRIAEIDVNPLFVREKGVIAADALIVLKDSTQSRKGAKKI